MSQSLIEVRKFTDTIQGQELQDNNHSIHQLVLTLFARQGFAIISFLYSITTGHQLFCFSQ